MQASLSLPLLPLPFTGTLKVEVAAACRELARYRRVKSCWQLLAARPQVPRRFHLQYEAMRDQRAACAPRAGGERAAGRGRLLLTRRRRQPTPEGHGTS